MYAQVVFDLPVERFFDYSIPCEMQSKIVVGSSVKVFFGTKKVAGIVIKISDSSEFKDLKPIKSLENVPLLDSDQIHLAQWMSSYYGCTIGQALFTIVRGSQGQVLGLPVGHRSKSSRTFYIAPSKAQEAVLESLSKPFLQKNQRILILVPDQFVALGFEAFVKRHPKHVIIGTRSAVFRSFLDISLIIMVDEYNVSYKQEQTPMYETRHVVLERAKNEHIELSFVSSVASVEMMDLINQGQVIVKELLDQNKVKTQVVDLNNYKILLKGILSPAVLSALESNIKKGLRSILVFNHRGLKIEQLHKALKEKFQNAKIEVFERGMDAPVKEPDILIGTIALLRFKNQMKPHLMVLLDIDSDLNHLDIQSCFKAFAMAQEFKGMAQQQFLIQSRHLTHYVIESLIKDDKSIFYKQDMQIRKELKVSPYGHQILIQLRHADQKLVQKTAQTFYEILLKKNSKDMSLHKPTVESIFKKRNSFRMNILLQGSSVADMIALINQAKEVLKRNQVILTLNVDG